ncbi:MAG: HEAT repeat domain-containing protein [Bacteroidota bacterium]
MEINQILIDKSIKEKEKVELLSTLLLKGTLDINEFIELILNLKDIDKGTCIEAIEYTTKTKPELATEMTLDYVVESLSSKAPRVKWESAKVIGNIIHKFPDKIDFALTNLLKNASHEGTVVRWSAAFALGEILMLKSKNNTELIPKVHEIIEQEEKNSIKKIYQKALKKV